MFLGRPSSNICWQNFDPSINMALVNGEFLYNTDMKKLLNNLLLWNRWSGFEIISQECSLGGPLQKLFVKFWSVQKHGSGEWGLLGHEDNLKNLLLRIFWSDFEIISQDVPWATLFKNCLWNFDSSINMVWWMGTSCTIRRWRNSYKVFFSKTTGQFLKLFHYTDMN